MALVQVAAPVQQAITTLVKTERKSLDDLQARSHVTLRKGLRGEALVAFDESLKRLRDQQDMAEFTRLLKKQKARIRVAPG